MLLDPASLGIAAASLLLVVVLVMALGRFLRLAGAGRGSTGRRLAVIEAVAVDPRRRLVLVRCDGREALVLTGPGGDLLVEGPR